MQGLMIEVSISVWQKEKKLTGKWRGENNWRWNSHNFYLTKEKYKLSVEKPHKSTKWGREDKINAYLNMGQ